MKNLSPVDPVKYNPNKTHFEQMLEYINYHDNPDITYNKLHQIIFDFLRSINPEAKPESLYEIIDKMSASHHDMYCYERYIRDGKKNYRIAKDFSEALADASLDISCKYIPKTNQAYNIQFHKEVALTSLFGEKDIAYRNCYVTIEDCTTEYDKKRGYIKRVMLVFPVYMRGEEYYSTYDFVNLVFKDENQKVTEALLDSAEKLEGKRMTDEGMGIVKYITNILLYLNSGDPDLRELKKPNIPRVSKNIKKFQKKNKHKTLLDIFDVGFDYMKGITYRVSSTMVRGHFRWQPCGIGREEVKLIWIGEHPRNFEAKDKSSRD